LWVIEKGYDPTGANGTGNPDVMVLTA